MTTGSGSLITRGTTPDGTPCAVKQLRSTDSGREDLALRLDNERRVLAFLDGTPGVIRLLGVRDRPLALLLEWADGGSLDERMGTTIITAAERKRIARELVAAVAACHRRGVVHRDIKPSNLLFVGTVLRLADFGVAAWGTPRRALPEGWEEDAIGTPPWSGPELRVAAGAATSPAVDIYGTARTLDLLLQHRRLDGTMSATLSEWIATALDEDPARRPSLGELPEIT
ncbi:MAG TPA: protein kinase [Gemmatimonadales bacterium]